MKTVVNVQGDGSQTVLAAFEMSDGELLALYQDGNYQAEVTVNGILVGDDVLYPSDGQTFYDVLELAYANSSRMDVISDD